VDTVNIYINCGVVLLYYFSLNGVNCCALCGCF